MKIQTLGIFHSINEFEYIIDPIKKKSQLGHGSFGKVELMKHKSTGN